MYESIKAFSARTGFSYWAVRNMCLQGTLPYVTVGTKKMINVESALQILKDMSEKG